MLPAPIPALSRPAPVQPPGIRPSAPAAAIPALRDPAGDPPSFTQQLRPGTRNDHPRNSDHGRPPSSPEPPDKMAESERQTSECEREAGAIAAHLSLPTAEFVSLLAEAAGQAPEDQSVMPENPGMPAAGAPSATAGTAMALPSSEPAHLALPAPATGGPVSLPTPATATDEPAAAPTVASSAAQPQHPVPADLPASSPPQHPGAAELPATTQPHAIAPPASPPPLLPGPVQSPLDAHVHTPVLTPPRAVPPDLVPITIASLASAGERRFDIRLDPADLGRIEVTLSVDSEGGVRTHLVVERPETLTLLRKDLPRLEQALDATGLKSDPSGISLGLRNGGQGHDAQARSGAAPVDPPHSESPGADTSPPAYSRPRALPGSAGRLDLIA